MGTQRGSVIKKHQEQKTSHLSYTELANWTG